MAKKKKSPSRMTKAELQMEVLRLMRQVTKKLNLLVVPKDGDVK